MSKPFRFAAGLACAVCAYILSVAQSPAVAAGDRLDQIRVRGFVGCGIDPGIAGFAEDHGGGHYAGFDIDICRALSAAIFGTPDKVRFVRASAVEEFLRSPDIDLVARRLTWTLTREAANGLLFGPITFYDGQGFLVPGNRGTKTAKDLSGATICVGSKEGQEANLARWAEANRLGIREMVIDGEAAAERAFFAGRCQAYSADVTMLGSARSRSAHPGEFVILPDMISKEPLAPLIRQGDDGFFEVVRWTILALIEAEELGVSSTNVTEMLKSRDPEVRRLLGASPGNGKALGLDESWVYAIISGVGNYGEIFDRNVGTGSPVRLDRGLNKLWTDGGLLYAPPVR